MGGDRWWLWWRWGVVRCGTQIFGPEPQQNPCVVFWGKAQWPNGVHKAADRTVRVHVQASVCSWVRQLTLTVNRDTKRYQQTVRTMY